MPTSQNGWPVVDQAAVTDRAILGVEFPNGWLRGDVDTVFTYLIGRLHREVEPMLSPGCWGWFVKAIEGGTSISNHASGTAIDYNAPAHPMGVRNTYSAADRARIRAILAELDGVVRWGGDYVGRPDDMHFEIIKGRAAVAAAAAKIKGEAMEAADFDKIRKIVAEEVADVAKQVFAFPIILPMQPGESEPRKVDFYTVVRWLDAAELDTRRKVLAAIAELAPADPPPPAE